MAWTAPRSWVTDEVVTSTILNTHVRDNLLALHHPYHVENTDIDVTNTAVQVSLFTSAPVITGGDMGTNGWIRATLWGDYFCNATARQMTLRVKFGGSTILTTPAMDAASVSANRKPWMLTVDIINQGATNAQWVAANAVFPAPNEPTSDLSTSRAAINEGATAAIDTTANQTFDISVQWDTAATTYSWQKLCSRVMLMQG